MLLNLFRSLRRNPASGRYLPEIDGLRFVSIASVVLVHIAGQVALKRGVSSSGFFYSLLQSGNFGVRIFFCISGFVLALPFAEAAFAGGRPVALKRYYWRRVTRIEPPYIVNLIVAFLIEVAVSGRSAMTLAQQAAHLLASLAYLHGLVFDAVSTVNGVAWSLEVEIQFYLLAPLLCSVFHIPGVAVRRALLLSGMTLFATGAVVASAAVPRLRFTLIPSFQYFLAGILVADIYWASWRGRPKCNRRWDFLALMAVACLTAVVTTAATDFVQPRPASILLPFLLVCLMAAAFRSRLLKALLVPLPLAVIGGMCYTIYLYHFAIIAATWPVVNRFAPAHLAFWPLFWLTSAVCLPLILIICVALFVLVERPFMTMGPARARRYRPFGDPVATSASSVSD